MHPLSAYVRATMAAEMLGITRNRIYEHIRENRLPAERQGKQYFILKEDIEKFKANPIGRTRSKPLDWRAYAGDVKVLVTEIDVRVRIGQQERLVEKLQAIEGTGEHHFPGTIARYVVEGDEQLNSVRISLIWKSTEMPAEEVRQGYLEAFQAELADVLDWETARMQTTRALLHT